jgi:hypothetical protein
VLRDIAMSAEAALKMESQMKRTVVLEVLDETTSARHQAEPRSCARTCVRAHAYVRAHALPVARFCVARVSGGPYLAYETERNTRCANGQITVRC